MNVRRGINPDVPPSGAGCVECDAENGWWVHLRRCAECGHIGCCDDSLRHHATRHFQDTGHPIMTSFEPGEDWFWDYETDTAQPPVSLAPPGHRPVDQTVPGPADRVPANWQHLLAQ